MSTAPKGWCPSLHEPMEAGDGLLLRLKPRHARLLAAEARLLARAATRHGNGAIDLTQRGNLQPRGFSTGSAKAFAEEMVAAGLAHADAAVERGRNLLLPPLLGWDPGLAPGTAALADALTTAMETWPVLPAKFGLCLDGGGLLPLAAEQADIMLRLENSTMWFRLPGSPLAAPCPAAEAVAAATRLARHFSTLAPARRMGQAVALRGAEALFRAAGLAATPAAPPAPPPRAIGPLAPGLLGVAAPFGQLQAAQLEALADLSAAQGDGTLRITPWRALLLPGGVAPAAVEALGMITDPADIRLRIIACTGAPGCASGGFETRATAAWLAARLPAAPIPAAGAPLLHVSGCAKGCAHPRPAPHTLLGRQGGRYALVQGGTAADPPQALGLTLEQTLAVLTSS